LAAAVSWELACDFGRLWLAVHEREPVHVPIGRVALTVALGWLALFRKTAWAGWVFAGLQYLGAGAMAFLSAFSLEHGKMGFYPGPFAFFLLYVTLAIAATYGVVNMEPRSDATTDLDH
jgi:hypothetical protein